MDLINFLKKLFQKRDREIFIPEQVNPIKKLTNYYQCGRKYQEYREKLKKRRLGRDIARQIKLDERKMKS